MKAEENEEEAEEAEEKEAEKEEEWEAVAVELSAQVWNKSEEALRAELN